MQRGMLMLLFGAAFTVLGLFAMPMKRANARQNLIDNPFGWGLFGFGLSSLLVGISAMVKERREIDEHQTDVHPINENELEQDCSEPAVH